jgi:hypothetical protein
MCEISGSLNQPFDVIILIVKADELKMKLAIHDRWVKMVNNTGL